MFWKVLTFFLISITAHAQLLPSDVEVLPDNQVLTSFQRLQKSKALPVVFEMASWNVQKGEGKDRFAFDLRFLSHSKDLILLQEGMNNPTMPTLLINLGLDEIWMAQSFRNLKTNATTGVLTLARAKAQSVFFIRSPGREPYLHTPKMTLGTVFQLSSGQPLLVVNLHGINFVSTDEFKKQIDSVIPVLARFHGKILFAGDFNTWSKERNLYLDQQIAFIGLTQIEFRNGKPKNGYGFVLDHIFVKGCKVLSAEVRNDVDSSDHSPISARLDCR